MTETVKSRADRAPVEGVVLLHGLGRTRIGMLLLARRLERAGFRTRCVGYRSRRLRLAEAVEQVTAAVVQQAGKWDIVHLVGHSLGGVIASAIQAARPDLPIGRVVTLGSPMRGSALAAFTGRILPLRAVFGPVLSELAEARGPRPRSENVGAIAGTTGNRIVGHEVGLLGPHDGKVTLRSAWAGARHRAAVPVGHAMLPFSRKVAGLAVHFLKHGQFPKDAERGD